MHLIQNQNPNRTSTTHKYCWSDLFEIKEYSTASPKVLWVWLLCRWQFWFTTWKDVQSMQDSLKGTLQELSKLNWFYQCTIWLCSFMQAALEKEWLTLDSTRFSSKTLLLSNQLHWPKVTCHRNNLVFSLYSFLKDMLFWVINTTI